MAHARSTANQRGSSPPPRARCTAPIASDTAPTMFDWIVKNEKKFATEVARSRTPVVVQ